MSFKREGNDNALLHLLKKRRIEELGTEDIPTDEAKKLRDGRFTCLVCGSVHIFDTMSILIVHRNTAKHLKNLKHFEKQKQFTLQVIDQRLAHNDKEEHKLLQKKKSILSVNELPLHQQKYKFKAKKMQPKIKLQMTTSPPKTVKGKIMPTEITSESKIIDTNNHMLCMEKVGKTVKIQNFEKYQLQQQLSTAEKQKIIDEEMQMRSQGWIKNNAGKWMKDPDVEFDSDESDGENPS